MLPLTNTKAARITYHCYDWYHFKLANSVECAPPPKKSRGFIIFLSALSIMEQQKQSCALKGHRGKKQNGMSFKTREIRFHWLLAGWRQLCLIESTPQPCGPPVFCTWRLNCLVQLYLLAASFNCISISSFFHLLLFSQEMREMRPAFLFVGC